MRFGGEGEQGTESGGVIVLKWIVVLIAQLLCDYKTLFKCTF